MNSATLPISCRRLTVTFDGKDAVTALDLDVRSGEVFGFLGPNGAGKTTTIRALLDLQRPSSGEVFIFGRDARREGPLVRGRMGFLPGDLALFPQATGQATLDLFTALQRRPAARRVAVLERLRFPMDALRRPVRTYSTGMRQALGITIAFQHAPELLVLDEPTSGLDPMVRAGFLDLVREARAEGRSVLLSSHVLDEIERTADRVGLITGGRLRSIEGVNDFRRRAARLVRYRLADGSEHEFEYQGDALPLLDRLRGLAPNDVEITPAGLESLFREDRTPRE